MENEVVLKKSISLVSSPCCQCDKWGLIPLVVFLVVLLVELHCRFYATDESGIPKAGTSLVSHSVCGAEPGTNVQSPMQERCSFIESLVWCQKGRKLSYFSLPFLISWFPRKIPGVVCPLTHHNRSRQIEQGLRPPCM